MSDEPPPPQRWWEQLVDPLCARGHPGSLGRLYWRFTCVKAAASRTQSGERQTDCGVEQDTSRTHWGSRERVTSAGKTGRYWTSHTAAGERY
ncbi:hypothetical protein JG688_00003536 [Phytophthora aleatoria]|uniref:Uncharacterized protein n=1 Tax=Phytophthora aleatoria TaxID=2496075 RepID=A0A8J5J1U0_9STRA|nr:hypothetical protein JG688_00003536 [Phytophthora aleatoria]